MATTAPAPGVAMVVRRRVGGVAVPVRAKVGCTIDAPSGAKTVPVLVTAEMDATWRRRTGLAAPVLAKRVAGDTALAVPAGPVTPAEAAAASAYALPWVVTGRPAVTRGSTDGLRVPGAAGANARVGAVAVPAGTGARRCRA